MVGKRKVSKKASEFISRKISKVKREGGVTQKQAIGKAFGIARGEGFRIPKKKGRK